MKRIRTWFNGLFGRRHQTAVEIEAASIERRQTAKHRHWIEFAANGNRLTASERRSVLREFERLAPLVGLAEARRMACDHASELDRLRRRRAMSSTDWHPPKAAA